ncbi:MAG: hypothetical protein FJZ01_22220 [Candidatus Sericytochromatia bacterium]|nr:hypothetical protein [Candidatus Tanganyikabacteria bacterium]
MSVKRLPTPVSAQPAHKCPPPKPRPPIVICKPPIKLPRPPRPDDFCGTGPRPPLPPRIHDALKAAADR